MTCNNCNEKTPTNVPYIVHESAMARAERQAKRLWVAILVLIGLLFGSNIAWIIYESQFEEVEAYEEIIIDAEQDGDGINIIGGGDVDYGTESEDCYTQED